MDWLRSTFPRWAYRRGVAGEQPCGAPAASAASVAAQSADAARAALDLRIDANTRMAARLLAVPWGARPLIAINGCPVSLTGLTDDTWVMQVEASDKDVRLLEMRPTFEAHLPTRSVYEFDLKTGHFDITLA